MPVREVAAADLASPEQFLREIAEPCRPVVIRGLVADWPVVVAARRSPSALKDYLAGFAGGSTVEAFVGAPHIAGKYYYAEDLRGFNFERRRLGFGEAVAAMIERLDQPGLPSIYVGSVAAEDCAPGFSGRNPMPLLPPRVAPRLWLGHAANVSAHYDAFDNLACVIAGARRFTLYAPELIGELYVGPIDNTMAGQPVSLAAASPDPERFPRFEAVRSQALVAELGPGDALYLPKLWWHQVESTAPLNGLVNYWWDAFAAGPDQPYAAMLLAMIAIGERPAPERAAWRAFFAHYVFRPQGHPLAHLPPEQHGLLGPLRENYGKIRARVMHMLRGG